MFIKGILMDVKVVLITLIVLFAGCITEDISSDNTNTGSQVDCLTNNSTNNSSIIMMNVSHGNSIFGICVSLNFADAPIHSENFYTHVTEGNYNGTYFHRIIDNFMIQGGDFENHDGTGGYAANWYGYCNGQDSGDSTCGGAGETAWTVPDEANNGLQHLPCTISMAKTSNPNTGGSQFFIIPEDSTPSHLDGAHTVFGQITDGCEHVTTISQVATASDQPTTPVILHNVIAVN